MSQASLPLSGLRVLDFSHAAAAPFATMFLADMGAMVIKIEKPKGGDGTRTMGVPIPALGPKETDYYVSLNRNKRSIVLDLGTPEGCELARRMARECDIVTENFRPGVMDRLGLGFEDLRKLLKKIEQSIARIDAGDYGYCDETGEPIGVGRLLARPTATLSLEAQQRRELKQKMFGD